MTGHDPRGLAFALLGALLSLAGAAAGADGDAPDTIGYRQDSTGVFPPDCAPVTTWNEWDFQQNADGKGPWRSQPAKENRVHIVWTTPLASYCNGGMIVAQGRLYQMVDRGGVAYAREIAPDFVGSRLVCMDPADGRILWHKDLDHLSQLPEDKREEARKDALDFYGWWPRSYGAFQRWNRAREKGKSGDREAYMQAAKDCRAAGLPVPETPEALDSASGSYWKFSAGAYLQNQFAKLMPQHFPDRKAQYDRLCAAGYPYEGWFGQGSFVGAAMQTPICDGRRLYISTAHYDAFCCDLDGKVIWCTWFGKGEAKPERSFGTPAVPSPLLTEDRLIVSSGDGAWTIRGLERETGKVVWKFAASTRGRSIILPLRVPVAATKKMLDLVWVSGGEVLRARDGKLLLEGVGWNGNSRPEGICGNIMTLVNGIPGPRKWPKGVLAVRLTAESEDTLNAELLWSRADLSKATLIHDNIVYADAKDRLEALNLADGKTLSTIALPFPTAKSVHHFVSLAGGYLFTTDSGGGAWLVAKAGRTLERVAMNYLGVRRDYSEFWSFNQGGQPFFSGNRIFIRSYTDVYCIGDSQEPLRLCKEHQ